MLPPENGRKLITCSIVRKNNNHQIYCLTIKIDESANVTDQKTTLIVHAGFGKTGTSSIQSTLRSNSTTLKKDGIKYLGRMLENCDDPEAQGWRTSGNTTFLKGPVDETSVTEVIQVLGDELDRLSQDAIHTAVWSHEAIAGRLDRVLPVIQAMKAKGHDVKVVAYVRRHDSWAKSAYVQWGIKHKTYPGKLRNFADWITERPIKFKTKIESWSGALGDGFHLRNYDAADDVVLDFLSFIGAAPLPLDKTNTAPAPEVTAAWAVYNAQFRQRNSARDFSLFVRDLGIGSANEAKLPDLQDMFPSTSQLADLVAGEKEDIAAVNAMLKAQGQPELSFEKPLRETPLATSWEMDQMLLRMVFALQRQVNELQTKLEVQTGSGRIQARERRRAKSPELAQKD